VEFHVSLVDRRDLAGEIYRQLRRAILDGRLRPGDALPPTRELAQRLSVSRTTVSVAYDRLNGEGFVISRVGAGTFVAEHVPSATRNDSRAVASLRARPIWDRLTHPATSTTPADFDFRTWVPDGNQFPYETWRRLIALELRAGAFVGGFSSDPAGHPALREAIVRHIGTSRGVIADPGDVTITNGAQQALDLVTRVLLSPGDRVAMEDPGYKGAVLLFESLGLKVTGVEVDAEGLVVDALPSDARLVYVTPSHQHPLGVAMSLSRRMALLDWAERHNAAVIEDDYDSEFRYGGRPVEPLKTLDTSGRVAFMGSFSKTMHPTLRLGFVVTPASLSKAVHAAKYVADYQTPLGAQAALAHLIDGGWFARHIRKTRTLYEARHDVIVRTLTAQFADHLTVLPSIAGLHVSATANALSPDEVGVAVERARDAGVAVPSLSMFRVTRPAQSGLVLGYGGIETERIPEGLRRLRRAFDQT
jgi:GntR family transcriptional regulator/MocR family aminotransferase